MYHVIKQLEEKQVVIEIDLMVWSDRLDLVAFSNTKGELALHRITWTKAWSLPPPREGGLITALAWRPDGKVIAVAYDTKELLLINVENKKILHGIKTRAGITCILWAQEKNNTNLVQDEYTNKCTQYMDESNNFIADPPTLANYSTNVVDDSKSSKFFQQQSELNLLFIGTDSGLVLFNIFGSLPCVEIDVTSYLQKRASPFESISCEIIKLHLTDDLSRLFVTLKDSENGLKMVILNTEIFKTHSNEIYAISTKQEKINGLVKYLDATLATLEEIFEGVLLEMDAKLSQYASRCPHEMLSVEFLDLLMFGIYNPEMDEFLLNELGLKGLEKFGTSLETSYANMQVLLFNHLAKAGKNISYHLIDLKGFSRLEHRFEILGLEEKTITESIQAIGSLLLKSGEMLHILDDTLVNCRAFIRWLTTATLYLMEEPIPSELQKRTQTDVLCIVEFIKNFDNISSERYASIGGNKEKVFVLERLGQYLADAPLSIKTDFKSNTWDTFLKNNNCIDNNEAIIKHMPEKSLIQQHKHLKVVLDSMYEQSIDVLINQLIPVQTIHCCRLGEVQKPLENRNLHITQINCGENRILHAFLTESETNGFYLVQTDVNDMKNITAQALYLYISDSSESVDNSDRAATLLKDPENVTTITDLEFYSNTVLSLLLRKQNSQQTLGVLCQLPVKLVQERFGDNLDLSKEDLTITEQNVVRVCSSEFAYNDLIGHVLEMAPRSLAVSGARKVAIVLATNRRSVRIYEMEADDDDDDEEDEEQNTLDVEEDLVDQQPDDNLEVDEIETIVSKEVADDQKEAGDNNAKATVEGVLDQQQ